MASEVTLPAPMVMMEVAGLGEASDLAGRFVHVGHELAAHDFVGNKVAVNAGNGLFTGTEHACDNHGVCQVKPARERCGNSLVLEYKVRLE